MKPTATVFDVAAYILRKCGPMSAMKLQKLVYYCQAWSLVWDERPMFPEVIEAWANGPVVRRLYAAHRGCFLVSADTSELLSSAQPEHLDEEAIATIEQVLTFYGDKDAQWLSALTHKERPWIEARGRCADGDSSEAPITHASMEEYYGSLFDNGQAASG